MNGVSGARVAPLAGAGLVNGQSVKDKKLFIFNGLLSITSALLKGARLIVWREINHFLS